MANGYSSLWFLAILPAFLSALICYIGDPKRTRDSALYWLVPPVLVALVAAGSIWFLREGIICLIMLSPIWLISGWAGAFILRRVRGKPIDTGVFRSSLLLLPLLAGMAENSLTFAPRDFTVTRQVVVDATPQEIWPYTLSNAHIAPSEGRWTFSQNIVGLPRPSATVMDGTGTGAIRTAYWGDHIHFDEIITRWQPGRRLAWDFRFTNTSLQDYTDKHISPDGPILKVASGEYRFERLASGKTRVTLSTRYTAKTHVNLYAAAWGELFLGDVQNNILAVVKDRAEKGA
jgi:hypothetical protein